MNYKLAKQLKEAGYKDEFDWNWLIDYENNSEGWRFWSDGQTPTLSELIDACGERIEILARTTKDAEIEKGKWVACSPMGSGYGKTPEEAVAKLWLKLNS